MSGSLPISDYSYHLPEDRIAHFPLANRDESRLLVYRKGKIEHTLFKSVVDYIPDHACLFLNNTKVIQARILFEKTTGAQLEVFLLNPINPSASLAETMRAGESCTWRCTIGNLKRWKENTILTKTNGAITLTAELKNRVEGMVDFRWTPTHLSFAEVLSAVGATPLPPYIKRAPEPEDISRYQTIYSQFDGAVAAPTAGLHFTDTVFEALKKKKIKTDFLTLHVSAGTFQPVKSEDALDHTMHEEQVIITRQNIENLLTDDSFVLAVGTTSMRTLESLYWYGVKLLANPEADFVIRQHDPVLEYSSLPKSRQALRAVLESFIMKNVSVLSGHTSIYIYPGYKFRVCNGLITNFHLPGSTLILLVAAFVGNDWWNIYREALNNKYRFLSYGDSSLLIP